MIGMVKGCIYRHWIVNDKGIEKSYIGLHSGSQPEKDRWGKNGNGYKPQNDKKFTKFYNAIKKYGWDSFNHVILEWIEAETIEKLMVLLNEKEKYYINQYDSYYNGYNSTFGGEGIIVSPAVTTARTVINIIEGKTCNDKGKLKNVKNKIRLFNNEEKQYFMSIMKEYFGENKDIKNYAKRLEKFNIKLEVEEFVSTIFFKQFSFNIYDTIWDTRSHFGVGKNEKAYPYELLFTRTGDVLHIREKGATCGQLCRLHSTIFRGDIYAKNTFSSKKITTKWY